MSEINFLHPKFESKVVASCAAEDDYQPSNLLSSEFWEQDRGFMAYNVVKPPVNLTFSLQHHIRIKRIKLWPALGSLRSIGFDINIVNGKDDATEHTLVGRCHRINADILEFGQCESTEPTSSFCRQISFFSSNFVRKLLANTNTIQVTITATQRCAVVLKRIEIWGIPSEGLDHAARRKCENIWRAINSPKIRFETLVSTKPSELVPTEDVPEEFLDLITCELMLFPMRLPCGKTVDQSTIEKHSRIEENWGRAPSDPFTGKLFTANSKPILDVTLKARVDKYLIQNSHRPEFKNVPRTLGKRNLDERFENSSEKSTNSDSYKNPPKRMKSNEMVALNPTIIPLEEAMQSALTAIRQRASSLRGGSCNRESNKCRSCSSDIYLYKIKSCDHIMCRACLNRIKSTKACTCTMQFVSSDVERIFE